MRSLRLALVSAAALVACAALAPSAFGLSTRTWVSGVGDDANPCSRTAPCKTFAGAISKTAEGGEIDALDPAGFGAVTITKSITIDGGAVGGVLNAGTNGIIVNSTNAVVVLRRLLINGASPEPPPSPCPYTALNGIQIKAAKSVNVEDSSISEQAQAGIAVLPSATSPDVVIDGVSIRNTCGNGIDVAPTATGSASVLVRNTAVSNTAIGLHAGAASHAWITGSSFFANTTGILADGGGIIDAIDTNQIVNNGTNGAPSSTTSTAPPIVTPGPTVTNTTITPGPIQVVNVPTPAPVQCIVPTLTGLTSAAATAKLTKANCAIGAVSTKATASKKLVGKVLSQKTEAGTTAKTGTKVSVTLGKAKAKAKKSKKRATHRRR